MNKRLLLLLVVIMSAYATGYAQVKDITFTTGINAPMYKGVEGDVTLGLNYGHFDRNGLGFRAGVQWTPSVANVDNSFGLPLAFVWRTASRNTKERLYSGAAGAADALEYGANSALNVPSGAFSNVPSVTDSNVPLQMWLL